MLDYNEGREKVIISCIIGGSIILIGGLIYTWATWTEEPRKSLEEIRAERADKFHEAGKDGHAFIKGLVGK